MATTTYYCWKVWTKNDDESLRLIDPWADPFEYEHPFNFQFDTEKEARLCKASNDFGPSSEEDWVLVKVEETVVVL